MNTIIDGTFELCGPKVQGNPERFETHQLVKHGLEIIDLGDYKIDLIKEYPCNSKRELEAEEFRIQNETANCVNIYGKIIK